MILGDIKIRLPQRVSKTWSIALVHDIDAKMIQLVKCGKADGLVREVEDQDGSYPPIKLT